MRLNPPFKPVRDALPRSELNMEMVANGWIITIQFLLTEAAAPTLGETVGETSFNVTANDPRIFIVPDISAVPF